MKTISADYNAMTESGHVRLTLPCSQEGILRLGLRPGDWTWLSDTEIVVGAQLAIDDYYGLVGVPDWDTLAHLDDEGADDVGRIMSELDPLLSKENRSGENEPRIVELLIQLEHAAPPQGTNESPGILATRRAFALRDMGKLGLALLEIEDARHEQPEDQEVLFMHLDLLREENLPSAVLEAQSIAEKPDVATVVLSACINILAMHSEHLSGEEFESAAQKVLGWCHRFDRAPDLDNIEPSLVALSYFNRGLVHLQARAESLSLNRRSSVPNSFIPKARHSMN